MKYFIFPFQSAEFMSRGIRNNWGAFSAKQNQENLD
jgi:hypothetical protein